MFFSTAKKILMKHTLYIAIGLGLAFLAVALVVFALPSSSDTNPHIFIALGDSVPSGYGLPGYGSSPEGTYTKVLYDWLESDGYVDEYYNMATSGFTTAMVLDLLNSMDEEKLAVFRDARIVTLNIGGNNLLLPFVDYLSELQIVSGAGNIASGTEGVLSGAWGVLYEIISGVGSVIVDDGGSGFSIGGIFRGMGNAFIGLGELVMGTGEILSGLPDAASIWLGDFSPELQAMLYSGVEAFTEEFVEIIDWLETHSPGAIIIVNTIYNPIPQEILLISVPISSWAGEFLDSINRTIARESELRGFLVADVDSLFAGNSDLTWFNLNPFADDVSLDFIHPNAQGHELIAAFNYAVFDAHVQDISP